jgi:hypothetical protein
MASKTKTCDFCGKRGLRAEMIKYEDKLMCDNYCKKLFIEAYVDEEEVKK